MSIVNLSLCVPGFGAVAVEYSEDQATRYRGGDMGWVQAGRGDARYDPAVIGALFKLDPVGGISELIETARGYYLVRLTELRGERVKPLEEVEKSIEHELMIENRKRIEAEWKQQIRAGFPVERFPAVLARIQPPDTEPGAGGAAAGPVIAAWRGPRRAAQR